MAAKTGLGSIVPTHFLIFSLLGLLSQVYSKSLYSDDDEPIRLLNSANFDRTVLRKNNAWIIEFYLTSCPVCVNFAPKWIAFAKDIQKWSNIIEVGVVACGEDANVELCQKYMTPPFPKIKLFWTSIDEHDKGSYYTGVKNMTSLRHEVIKFLESQWSRGIPDSWPVLDFLQVDDIAEMWSKIPESVEILSILIEGPNSFVGREVILDLSLLRHLVIRRVSTENHKLVSQLMNKYKSTDSTAVILLKAERNGKILIQKKFLQYSDDTLMRNEIFKTLAGYSREDISGSEQPRNIDESKTFLQKGPYLSDLENSVIYSLRKEVGDRLEIDKEQLNSLKAYLATISTHFRGSPHFMDYIKRINKSISDQYNALAGKDFLKLVKNLQTDKENFLEIREWVGCKGSKPEFRGFTCSVWMLFHTMTVQAYTSYEEDPRNEDPRNVLFAMNKFITHLFTCGDCSEHFQEMTINLKNELKNPADAVLWLWKAHNVVNRRTAGDDSEDPQHKKVQFPPVELCQKCRLGQSSNSEDIQWDNDAVLQFLVEFYGQKNIMVSNEFINNEGVNIRNNVSEAKILLLISFLFWVIF